jgi:arabinosyltransferase C
MPETIENHENIAKFARRLALVLALIAAIPWLVAMISAPASSVYIGSQFATDDQMVYSAWMNQAMNGQFLFDNRFATDEQPGLTIHLYFWLLGILAIPFKSAGAWIALPLISNLARIGFTYLFVILLGKLGRTLELPVFIAKTGMVLACLGGGVGFAVWESFGRRVAATNPILQSSNGWLPIDVWQPEAFVFPSALVNGLFMASLCLIIGVFITIWKAQDSWQPVPIGAFLMLLLMNIHSYDVLIIAFTLLVFAATLIARKQLNPQWALRAGVIGLGAIPSALWFLNVLSQDKVFQARAETLTYTGTFPQILLGILPLFLLGTLLFRQDAKAGFARWVPAVTLLAVVGVMFAGAGSHDPDKGYYLTLLPWLVALIAITVPLFLGNFSKEILLLCSWACIALILPYLPQLFQRKLAMGLIIPWGFLAAYGIDWLLTQLGQIKNQSDADFRVRRNLMTGVLFLISCATNVYWLQREILMIKNNISSTTVHPVFLPSDIPQILNRLNQTPGRIVAIARPGVPLRSAEAPWASPYLPELNPVLSGFSPAYSYAGHWSETPDYNRRRGIAEMIFQPRQPEEIAQLLKESGVTHVVQPIPAIFPELPSNDLSPFGEIVYEGRQFRLIEIDQTRLR